MSLELTQTACSGLEKSIESHHVKEILVGWKVEKVTGLQADIDGNFSTTEQILQVAGRERSIGEQFTGDFSVNSKYIERVGSGKY